MFFDHIKRNGRRMRKDNGVYFSSIIISIIAFYVILSLGDQDVLRYLKTIESDAVSKLLALTPVLYVLSLFLLFFLVYFTNRYQMQRRSYEFGMYLMLGMKRITLFSMIMSETLWNCFVALLAGLPAAVILTELIGLLTSRLVGIGIIGHEFTISWTAVLATVCGTLAVQLFAVLILSIKTAVKQPYYLLQEREIKAQKIPTTRYGRASFISGVVLLALAYFIGVRFMQMITFQLYIFPVLLFLGITGTSFFFKGLGSLVGASLRRKSSKFSGLSVFTARQLQENVMHQWGSLAVSSLLILMAVICFVYGISSSVSRSASEDRTVDFTIRGEKGEIESILAETDELDPFVSSRYEMRIGMLDTEVSWDSLIEELSRREESMARDNLIRDFSDRGRMYVISLSGYNALLSSIGADPIELTSDEAAMFSHSTFSYSHSVLQDVLSTSQEFKFAGKEFSLEPELYTYNVVADRSITLAYALIVPDSFYDEYAFDGSDKGYYNMMLHEDIVNDRGLMQAMHDVSEILSSKRLEYESYLASMGRQLFYMVAGSYTTFYLGIMFLIIANTVLGVKFLMQQQTTKHRYAVASSLGALTDELQRSAKSQIRWYFGLALIVALISSIFGLWSLMGAFFLSLSSVSVNLLSLIAIMVCMVAVFIAFELIYIQIICRKSDNAIRQLIDIE